MRQPGEQIQQYIAEIQSKPAQASYYHHYERHYVDRVQQLLDGPDEVIIPLQTIRIGELGIAAIPFEVFVTTGLDVKDQTPFADAFTIELANDQQRYLPKPEQHQLGGYEIWMGTCNVQPDASERIKQAILEMMNQLL